MNAFTAAEQVGFKNEEKMADSIDFSSMLSQVANDHAVSELRKSISTPPKLDPDFDGKHCVECGEKINPKRIEAMAIEYTKEIDPAGRLLEKTFKLGGKQFLHGTDKCIHCQNEINHANNIKARQYA